MPFLRRFGQLFLAVIITLYYGAMLAGMLWLLYWALEPLFDLMAGFVWSVRPFGAAMAVLLFFSLLLLFAPGTSDLRATVERREDWLSRGPAYIAGAAALLHAAVLLVAAAV
ncbi:MAG: hypothetical protein H0S85_16490 [Desulfovibrionaceae bacterium]|jgi:hypothetical protein|nr:hypothetical protein [Desulfovibrionaceae bacterium]